MTNNIIDKALVAERESKHIDFKSKIDFSEGSTWCEVVKDVVAMANSGGGAIVIGCDNQGKPLGSNISSVLGLDPAILTDQIYKYTGVQFSDVGIIEKKKGRYQVAIIVVGPTTVPIVFTKPGVYRIDPKTQKTAFSAGTVYFRHGAKSEPGNTDDIRNTIDRQIEAMRKTWLKGVRKVVDAPAGSLVYTFPPSVEVRESTSPDAKAIRIVDDPDAPAYKKIDYDISHPHQQKDVITIVNRELPDEYKINQHDIQCIKRLHKIEAKEAYCHRSKFTGFPQYTNAFVQWLLSEFKKDNRFFLTCRKKAMQIRKEGQQKNRGDRE